MVKEIKRYFLSNKKNIRRKATVLALFLCVMAIFYADIKLAQRVIFTAIENEKKTHALEVCEAINKIDGQSDFFLGRIDEIRSQKSDPSKDKKKEIIIELRKIESGIRSVEISYFGFLNNDFSIKFFSENNNTEADRLFSQIKNLPIYGYRAVDSMEGLVQSDQLGNGQLDVTEIEFSELKAKIGSIKDGTSICQ